MSEELNFSLPEWWVDYQKWWLNWGEKSQETYQEEERQLKSAVRDTRKQSFSNLVQAQYLVVLLKTIESDEIIGDIIALTKIWVDWKILLQIVYPFIFQKVDDETIKREFWIHQYDTQTINWFSQSIRAFVHSIPPQIFSAQNFHQWVVKYIFDICCEYNVENLWDDKSYMQKNVWTPKYDEYKQKLQSTIDQIFATIFW